MTEASMLSLLPWLAFIFMLSGSVKGLTGFGLPFVAMPLTTMLFGIPVTQAMGWVLVSAFMTNIIQLIQARSCWRVLKRIWVPVLILLSTMILSVQLLTILNSDWLLVILGTVIVLSIASQLRKRWVIESGSHGKALVVSGFFSGLFGGLTAFYGFPFLPTLMATGIRNQSFIFAASFILFSGGLVLAAGLGLQGLMKAEDAVLSVLLLPPALVGLLIGQRVRLKFSLERFERIVFLVLLGTGTSMLARGLIAVSDYGG